MNEISDNVLVENVLKGDTGSYEVLVKKYQKPVFNLAFRMTGNYDDANDVAQSAFVKGYEKLETFDPRYKFFSWIYRIALNESLNTVSAKKRFVDVEDTTLKSSDTPLELYETVEQSERLHKALSLIKEDYKVLIVLKHFEELSYEEISDVLKISVQKVKSRLFMARQLLKELLLQNDRF